MSYENRMYFRMALPWLVSGFLTLLAVWITTVVADLPLIMAAHIAALGDAPLTVAGIGTFVTTCIGAWQIYRLWRWQKDEAPECMVCGCLMGGEYQARRHMGRRCLGCRKFVPTR
jgi:hypothetical protein